MDSPVVKYLCLHLYGSEGSLAYPLGFYHQNNGKGGVAISLLCWWFLLCVNVARAGRQPSW